MSRFALTDHAASKALEVVLDHKDKDKYKDIRPRALTEAVVPSAVLNNIEGRERQVDNCRTLAVAFFAEASPVYEDGVMGVDSAASPFSVDVVVDAGHRHARLG